MQSHLRDARRARPEREVSSNYQRVGRGEKRAGAVFVLERDRHFAALGIVRARPDSDALEGVARRRRDDGSRRFFDMLLRWRVVVLLLLLLRGVQR